MSPADLVSSVHEVAEEGSGGLGRNALEIPYRVDCYWTERLR